MRLAKIVLAVSFLQGVIVFPLGAEVWRVGPGGDFAEIQEAIQAASDGDVILVEPGSYLPFIVDKGVTVRSTAERFHVQSSLGTVVVTSIPSGQKAAIAGMLIESDWTTNWPLSVLDSEGEVILEDVYIASPMDGSGPVHLAIRRSSNVSISSLDIPNVTTGEYQFRSPGSVDIKHSQVRLSDVRIRGGDGDDGPEPQGGNGFHGSPGLSAEDSLVVLARCTIQGGDGGDALVTDPYDSFVGGHGGYGFYSKGTEVVILGESADSILGGHGGDGEGGIYGGGAGGRGGAGVSIRDSQAGRISRVFALGGDGGSGGTDGRPGVHCENCVREDIYPYLDMGLDWRPGRAARVTLNSTESATAILLVSGSGGFRSLQGFNGAPFSAFFGTFWYPVAVGTVEPFVDRVISFLLPDDPILRGLSINVQGAFLGTLPMLSNTPARVLKD